MKVKHSFLTNWDVMCSHDALTSLKYEDSRNSELWGAGQDLTELRQNAYSRHYMAACSCHFKFHSKALSHRFPCTNDRIRFLATKKRSDCLLVALLSLSVVWNSESFARAQSRCPSPTLKKVGLFCILNKICSNM